MRVTETTDHLVKGACQLSDLIVPGQHQRFGREAFFGAYVEGDAKLARALLDEWPKAQRSIARHARGYAAPG